MNSELAAGVQLGEGTASLAVLWLTRSLHFILEMLRLFTQRTSAPPPPSASRHTHLARLQLSRAVGARISESSNDSAKGAGSTPEGNRLVRSFDPAAPQLQLPQCSVQCDAFVNLDDGNPDELVEIASEAYEKTLRKHHNWIVRGIVRVG